MRSHAIAPSTDGVLTLCGLSTEADGVTWDHDDRVTCEACRVHPAFDPASDVTP